LTKKSVSGEERTICKWVNKPKKKYKQQTVKEEWKHKKRNSYFIIVEKIREKNIAADEERGKFFTHFMHEMRGQ
jgi:hypothetical protein